MNAVRLFALYNRVAEAPDAVSRLRRFVLDLAVRGKLVEQDPSDEPASELLNRIAVERARLVKAGKIKAKKALPESTHDNDSFRLPNSWSSVRLAEIAVCLDYMRKPINATERAKRIEGKPQEELFPYYGATRQQGWIDDFLFDEELVLLGEDGVPFFDRFRSKAYLIRGKTWVNNHAHVFRGILVSHPYLVHVLNVFDYTGRVVGATRSKLNQTRALGIPTPLPPLAEQHRIVAKVDELMVLCDQLDEARTAREDTRDRLTKASLTRLIAHDIDAPTFRSHARFAVGALPALTARADQVKHLRQTILGLAVRGKLVEQDPADGPLPSIDGAIPHDLEPPFRVPAHWRWSRIRALGTLKGGGTPSKARGDFWNGSIPWVSPKEMKLDYIANAKMRITEAAIAASAVNVIEPESILFVVRGMILAHSFPVAISRVPLTINQDMKAVILKKPEMAEYLLRALKALKPEMLARVQRSSHGTCRIVGTDYGDFMIPIPPFAEQHRIVAKVDELMALCDRMATGLAAADGTRIRLLDSLLHDALASAAYEAATTTRPGARNTWTERARSGGVPSRS